MNEIKLTIADAMKYLTKMFEAIEKTRGHTPSMEKPVAHKLTEQELNASKSWQKLKKH